MPEAMPETMILPLSCTTTPMSTTPEQFAGMGMDLLTEWQQNYERLVDFVSDFEARGGINQFNEAKAVAAQGESLTPEQIAGNAKLVRLSYTALDVVTHFVELRDWYTTRRQARIAIHRTDF
jgi:hypothetical protein